MFTLLLDKALLYLDYQYCTKLTSFLYSGQQQLKIEVPIIQNYNKEVMLFLYDLSNYIGKVVYAYL